MADLVAICEALAANLDQIPNVQVSPYMLGNPTPPAIDIQPEDTSWDKAFGRGLDERILIVRAFVPFTTDIGAAKRLYEFLAGSGQMSVKQAAESDPRLGGLVDDLHVTRTTRPRLYDRQGGGPLLGAEWHVRVLAPGIT